MEAPGGAGTRVLRGIPWAPSEGPGPTLRWSWRPFLLDGASAWNPQLDRSLRLSKETPTCFSLPVTKTQIVPAVPSAEGPGTSGPPGSRTAPCTPLLVAAPDPGASLGESGLRRDESMDPAPLCPQPPAASIWADVAVSRNHGASLKGNIYTRKC